MYVFLNFNTLLTIKGPTGEVDLIAMSMSFKNDEFIATVIRWQGRFDEEVTIFEAVQFEVQPG